MINEKKIDFQGTEYSVSDLEGMNGPNMAALYSVIASNLAESSVRKFKDLATGVKRTWAILERYETWADDNDEAEVEVDAEDTEDFDPDFDEPKEEVIGPQQEVNKRRSAVIETTIPLRGVGNFIKEQLRDTENSPAQIIEKVREKFPNSKATTKDVAWYKCKQVKKPNVSE